MSWLRFITWTPTKGLTQEETWQNKTHEQVHVAQREAAARDTFSTADG